MDTLGDLAKHLARLFAIELTYQIKPLGIVPGQFPALLELYDQDGQTQAALVEKLDIEQATMANTLSRMERDGLVVRRIHPGDARARTVHLTEKALSIHEATIKAAREANAKALSCMNEREQKQFILLLQRSISSLREPPNTEGE